MMVALHLTLCVKQMTHSSLASGTTARKRREALTTMEEITRKFERNFAHGTVTADIHLSGEGVEQQQGLLDKIFSNFSESVAEKFVPHYNRVMKRGAFQEGQTGIAEELKIELLGITMFLDVRIDFSFLIEESEKRATSCFIIELLGPAVASAAVHDIAMRLKEDSLPESKAQHGRMPFDGIAIPLGSLSGLGGLGGPGFPGMGNPIGWDQVQL